MQEVVFLLYATFVLLEAIALLIGDAVAVLFARTLNYGMIAVCHLLRRLNTSERHSPARRLYYSQLIWLFGCLDTALYLALWLVAALIAHASLWLHAFLVASWLCAVARVFSEKRATRSENVAELSRETV